MIAKASRKQRRLRGKSEPLASLGSNLVSEDESIPDSYGCGSALPPSVGPHPWGGPSEGDDKDHDFLRRDEWREEGQFRNVEFRRSLLQRLQQHQAVRNPGEHAAWLGSPEDALQKLQDPRDPSRRELVGVSWSAAYSQIQLNLVDELISWITTYQQQDHPDSFDEELIPWWARLERGHDRVLRSRAHISVL